MCKRNINVFGVFLILAGISIATYAVFQSLRPHWSEQAPTSPPTSIILPDFEPVLPVPGVSPESGAQAPVEMGGLPVGKLVITPERKSYGDGAMALRIPVLNIECTVHDGTEPEDLRNGVGLYDYAQLPGTGNRNVSIAGHRNGISNGKVTDQAPFYYVDTLKEGDYLYLTDSEQIYRYLWESCTIVEANDWSPIYTTGYSCITLTSCHPIGISDHRIVIRGVLDGIFPLQKDFDYTNASEG